MSPPTVFISYSHKDEAWKNRLVPHLDALERAGVPMTVWHDRKIDGGEKWYPEIQAAMENAAVAVLLISPDFLASGFITKEEVPYLIERQEKHGMLLIPVLVRPCPWKAHRWLAARQMIPRDGKSIAIDFPGDLVDVVFSAVADSVYLHFDQLASQPQKASVIPPGVQALAQAEVARIPIKASEVPLVQAWPELPDALVELSNLPETGAALFGRDDELSLLDKVWAGEQQPGDSDSVPTRVLAFKAQGGVGKSTLINHWLAEMRRDHFRGATRVFGWSFYSQGVREHGAPSADTFVAAALRFFGDEALAASSASAWEKGERLARLVSAERALLVLDGMEPLQSAQPFQRGKLQDPALESLLRGLARHSAGLCIITTRETLAELGKKAGIVERDLEQITPQAGRALLRAMHILGSDAELEALAERFGPHALAISLLAVFLHEQPGRRTGPARELEKLPGQTPVDRVLAGFEQWLGDGAELEALRLLGFFDRPADEGCLRALRERPAIPGLTDAIAGMTDPDWHRVLTRLEKLRLVHIRRGESGKCFVDTHPLVREHFAARVREHQPEAWRAAHRRLYEHLCASTREGDEPALEDLQPLYQAVSHGCQAGLIEETRTFVYRDRILRGNEYYSLYKLGAFSSDLAALAAFFAVPWTRLKSGLSDTGIARLPNQAAYCLRALGRLTEAVEPMKLGLATDVSQENWKQAAQAASNLSGLELLLGEVTNAVRQAEQSVAYADRSGHLGQQITRRATHGNALHHAGRRVEAARSFREAEEMQAETADYPQLYSVQGFQYCDLLLAAPEIEAWRTVLSVNSQPDNVESTISDSLSVRNRAAEALKIAQANRFPLLTLALDYLTLGRAAFYEAILSGASLMKCHSDLDNAVIGLRHAGMQDHVPQGLLTRAWFRFLADARTGSESAQEDLEEAWEIAERGPMKLFMVDIHLYRGRLFFREAKYPWESPAADLAAAEKLINDCGYHRRDEELADAKRAILSRSELSS